MPVLNHASSGFVIRKAAHIDAQNLSRMLRETWHENFDATLGPDIVSQVCDETYLPSKLEKQVSSPKLIMLVALDEDQIVGHAMGATHEDATFIHRLYVHPSAQRRGLATQLLETVLAELPQTNEICLEVVRDNPKALAFYARHGFEIVGEMSECLGNESIPSLKMSKKAT